MKTLLIALFLSLPFVSNAQYVFAPPGAEWYYTQTWGIFHSYNAGDTTINGKSCGKIVRKAITKQPEHNMGLTVSDLHPLYTYNTADTVFAYNRFFNRFTPLFVFNVHDGDIIHLPIIPLDIAYLNFISTDSTFSIVVDSVRMKLYDTATLKTVYTHPIGDWHTNYVYSYAPYAERIGQISGGLVPTAQPATELATESLQTPTNIRCYNDPTLSIKLTTGLCGLPPTEVTQLENNTSLHIYPIPATNEVTITAPGKINSLVITTLTGQTIYSQVHNDAKVEIDISALPVGMYYVRINGFQYQKFLKQ